jgi:hypothetical protein
VSTSAESCWTGWRRPWTSSTGARGARATGAYEPSVGGPSWGNLVDGISLVFSRKGAEVGGRGEWGVVLLCGLGLKGRVGD